MINCCAIVCDIDFNHYEKEHTQQQAIKIESRSLDKVLAKGDRQSDAQQAEGNTDAMNMAEIRVCVLRASFD